MKKFVIFIVLMIFGLNMNAKEVAKNISTGMKLDETAGVYSLKSKSGIIILGDRKTARSFMLSATTAFTQKMLDSLSLGEDKFEVHEDETGMYIIKVGLGAMKIRPSDTTQFLTILEAQIVKEKTKKIWNIIKE